MSSSLRALRLFCCLLLLAVGGLTITSAPASATWTLYCTSYTRCADAGYSNAGYSKVSSTMYWRMYGGHNCTNYVAYRMVHAGMPNTRPWTGSGNASNWGAARSDLTNQTPTVGAVAWWKANAHPAGASGHVAYVERVIDSSTIVVSQDSWGGDFSWAKITKGSGSWPSGFIHFQTQQLKNTALPTITGTPQAGVKLTASAGSWSPTPSTTTYQWKVGGTAISGATSKTYTPTLGKIGKTLTVTVSAARSGSSTVSATSAATAAVKTGVLRAVQVPSVKGTPSVGSVLTANPGTYSPAATSVRYQWLSGGKAVTGATAASLPVDQSLVGKVLAVKVVAKRKGYPDTTTTSASTTPVALRSIGVATPAAITGKPRLGGRLTLVPATFTPSDATSTSQWWQVGGSKPLGTGPTYSPTVSDLGRRLEVRTTVAREGYAPLVVRTPATGVVHSVPKMTVVTRSTGSPHGSVRVTVRVVAPGVKTVTGHIYIGRKGHMLARPALSGGTATTTVLHIPLGVRVLRVRYTGTTGVGMTPLLRRIIRVR